MSKKINIDSIPFLKGEKVLSESTESLDDRIEILESTIKHFTEVLSKVPYFIEPVYSKYIDFENIYIGAYEKDRLKVYYNEFAMDKCNNISGIILKKKENFNTKIRIFSDGNIPCIKLNNVKKVNIYGFSIEDDEEQYYLSFNKTIFAEHYGENNVFTIDIRLYVDGDRFCIVVECLLGHVEFKWMSTKVIGEYPNQNLIIDFVENVKLCKLLPIK